MGQLSLRSYLRPVPQKDSVVTLKNLRSKLNRAGERQDCRQALWTRGERAASENRRFWRLLCALPTFVAFFGDQRKDLGEPSSSLWPGAVRGADVKCTLSWKMYYIIWRCPGYREPAAHTSMQIFVNR